MPSNKNRHNDSSDNKKSKWDPHISQIIRSMAHDIDSCIVVIPAIDAQMYLDALESVFDTYLFRMSEDEDLNSTDRSHLLSIRYLADELKLEMCKMRA